MSSYSLSLKERLMPRPSKNIDKQLIKTGVEMLRESGITQFNVREVVKQAGVNLGMFHYHFKTKEAFKRAVLQEFYETIFTALTLDLNESQPAIEQLRQVLKNLAFFMRDHRHIMISVLADLSMGDQVAEDFATTNFPRHIRLIFDIVTRAQKDGQIISLPTPQVILFVTTSIAGPMLVTGLISKMHLKDLAWVEKLLANAVLTDEAIDQRVGMAIKGVSP